MLSLLILVRKLMKKQMNLLKQKQKYQFPPIGNTRELYVPLEYLIGGYFLIKDDRIIELGSRPYLYQIRDEKGNVDYVEQLDPALDSYEGPTYAPGSPNPSGEEERMKDQLMPLVVQCMILIMMLIVVKVVEEKNQKERIVRCYI